MAYLSWLSSDLISSLEVGLVKEIKNSLHCFLRVQKTLLFFKKVLIVSKNVFLRREQGRELFALFDNPYWRPANRVPHTRFSAVYRCGSGKYYKYRIDFSPKLDLIARYLTSMLNIVRHSNGWKKIIEIISHLVCWKLLLGTGYLHGPYAWSCGRNAPRRATAKKDILLSVGTLLPANWSRLFPSSQHYVEVLVWTLWHQDSRNC